MESQNMTMIARKAQPRVLNLTSRTDGRTDRQTDGRTDGRTDDRHSMSYPNFVCGGQKGMLAPNMNAYSFRAIFSERKGF